MTKERERDILRMYATPAGRKTVALNSRLLEIGAAWSNESTPEEDARLNEIVEGVIAEFMNASENKTSRQRRSEEHTSELQSLMRISYAIIFLKKQHQAKTHTQKT